MTQLPDKLSESEILANSSGIKNSFCSICAEVKTGNKGVGTRIIDDLCFYLQKKGYSHIRLGWVEGNPQAEHFWHKNGFTETGVTSQTENYIMIFAQRDL